MTLVIKDFRAEIGGIELVSIPELIVPSGARVGMVGESGSGKSMTALSIVGLQPRGVATSGSIMLDGVNLLNMSPKELAATRGASVGVVFQDPLRALNPVVRIGKQLTQAARRHGGVSRSAGQTIARELLERVALPSSRDFVHRYPHQLSGGQRQRVLIAIAIARRPKLLIADEPTTALDATVQGAILDLLRSLSVEDNIALLMVSHDLGVIRTICDDVCVMYGGTIVERGSVRDVVDDPRHRYTKALLRSSPDIQELVEHHPGTLTRMHAIPGTVPRAGAFPAGCRFRDRCDAEVADCSDPPAETSLGSSRYYRCWNPIAPTSEESRAPARGGSLDTPSDEEGVPWH